MMKLIKSVVDPKNLLNQELFLTFNYNYFGLSNSNLELTYV